jgi:hypothetical protein
VFVASLCLFASLLGGNLPAQQAQNKKPRVVEEEDDKQPKKKPPVEEEEDSGPKQKKKVIRVDDDDAPKAHSKSTGGGGGAFSGDLATLKDKAKHSGLRELCRKLFKPHDIINAEYSTRKDKLAVAPLAKDLGREPKLERDIRVTEFTQEWELQKPHNVPAATVKRYTPYEVLAQAEAENFLKESWDARPKDSADYMSKRDSFAAAANVLSEVDKWHRLARSKDIRQGDEWDKVQEGLLKQILEYR